MFRRKVQYTFVLPKEKANAAYYPGEIVRGQLLIESSVPVLLTGLQMRLTGEGKVTLMRQEGNIQRTMNRKETYLETCKLVQNLERLPLVNADQPNTCAFEFSFFLPPGLPPSFVSPLGSSGYVSYDMELIRVEAGKEKTLNKTKIIVAPLLTFERMPSALDPVVREGQGAHHWFCCVTERNITVRVWVDRAGVFAGGILPFHALIINNSQVSIQSSYLTMKRRWVYHTSYETMETQGKEGLFVKVVRRAVVPPGGSLTWGDHGPAIVLPACLIPSGPPGCSVMDLSYELSFTVVPAGMVRKMKLVLPILVGAALPEALREEVEGNTEAYFDAIARQRLLQQMEASTL